MGKKHYSKKKNGSKCDPRKEYESERAPYEGKATRGVGTRSSSGGRFVSKTNDPQWYIRNGQLTRDTFNVPFTWPTGRTLPIDYTSSIVKDNPGPFTNMVPSVPGIMSIKLAMFPGKSTNQNSAINAASRNLYSYVRHANSGHSNYDAPDLMMYVMAMDSLYSMYEWGKRAYGTVALAAATNRYYPEGLITAQGFNYNDLLEHIVDLRTFLNTMAIKLSSLCVPSSMSIIRRHRMLFSSVYRDSNDPKAQLYLYTPAHFFIYDEANAKLTGGLPSYAAGAVTFNSYVRGFSDRINAVLGSEDMNIMSGDILKAFGENNCEKVDQVPENYVVIPEYDEGVLYQMRNATLVGDYPADGSWDVTQNREGTNEILCNPRFKIGTNPGIIAAFKRILSAPNSIPTPEEVAEITRLAVVVDPTTYEKTNYTYQLDDFASDVAIDAWCWYLDSTNALTHVAFTSVGPSLSTKFNEVITTMSQFKHHPGMLVANSTLGIQVYGFDFEFDNYTVVDSHDVSNMHQAALLSMYSIPEYGAWDVGLGATKG